MRAQERGLPTPERHRGRERLTVRSPEIERALAGINFDGFDVAETRQFGNRLLAEARLRMARGGLGERGEISKVDAEMMWRKATSGAGAE